MTVEINFYGQYGEDHCKWKSESWNVRGANKKELELTNKMNERIINILCAHETKRKVKVVINMKMV